MGARYGNQRHPARDPDSAPAHGTPSGSNTVAQTVLTYGASRQSIDHARGLGLAVNTASPMSRGSRVWAGDPGTGVHRFYALVPAPHRGMTAGAIEPTRNPTAVRVGMQSGPSQAPAYPATGQEGGFGSPVAALDMRRLSNLGWGG